MSADERRHGPVELAELPGKRGYEVEHEVEPEPAHAASCRCLPCRVEHERKQTEAYRALQARREAALRRNAENEQREAPAVKHRRVDGPRYQLTAACGAAHYYEQGASSNAPQFAGTEEQVTCPKCLAARP